MLSCLKLSTHQTTSSIHTDIIIILSQGILFSPSLQIQCPMIHNMEEINGTIYVFDGIGIQKMTYKKHMKCETFQVEHTFLFYHYSMNQVWCSFCSILNNHSSSSIWLSAYVCSKRPHVVDWPVLGILFEHSINIPLLHSCLVYLALSVPSNEKLLPPLSSLPHKPLRTSPTLDP